MNRNKGRDAKDISAAKSRIGKEENLVGREAIQIHGGIGMTDEIDVGHIFKRLTTIQFCLAVPMCIQNALHLCNLLHINTWVKRYFAL